MQFLMDFVHQYGRREIPFYGNRWIAKEEMQMVRFSARSRCRQTSGGLPRLLNSGEPSYGCIFWLPPSLVAAWERS